jgi:hypothetical protein
MPQNNKLQARQGYNGASLLILVFGRLGRASDADDGRERTHEGGG